MKRSMYRTYKSEQRAIERAERLEAEFPGDFWVIPDPNSRGKRWIVTVRVNCVHIPCA